MRRLIPAPLKIWVFTRNNTICVCAYCACLTTYTNYMRVGPTAAPSMFCLSRKYVPFMNGMLVYDPFMNATNSQATII